MHKELIDNIFNDFKDFFPNKKDSRFIKYKLLDKISGGMKVLRTGTKSYIAISNDIKFFDIDTDISKIYILFMLGHELAHLVNKYLEYNDKNKFDSQAIEMWADYFGTKIAMCILQNGTRFNKMLDSNFNDINIGLEIIFNALIMMKNNIYLNTNSSDKYLNNNDRMATVIAAIIAFLTRKEMILNFKLTESEHAEIGSNWGIAINRKLFELELIDKLYTKDSMKDIDITLLVKNVFNIHTYLKQKNRQLIKGLDLYHSYILDSTYGEHKTNQLLINEVNKKLDKIGWNIKI